MPFAIEPSFNESSATTPLIFVLSSGSDPMASLLKFAEDRGVRVEAVSLGQGQGPIAQRWISKGLKEGFWVVRTFPFLHIASHEHHVANSCLSHTSLMFGCGGRHQLQAPGANDIVVIAL